MQAPANPAQQLPRRVRHAAPGAEVDASVFTSGRAEAHVLVRPTRDAPFAEQWRAVQAAYAEACARLGLSPETETQLTLHLSDPENQQSLLAPFLTERAHTAVSRCGQPTAGSVARVLLRAVHVGGAGGPPPHKTPLPDGGLRVEPGAYPHVWLPDLVAPEVVGAAAQSAAVFARLRAAAEAQGLDMARALVRTWIAVRDIDRDYAALLPARREAFRAAGMGALLPASTGIGGGPMDAGARLGLTALLYADLAPGQVSALAAPTHLPPAPSYGASFERGLVLRFGDRRHFHLSGTASIGAEGHVLHVGDVQAQTARTVVNLLALLASADAEPGALTYLLVYLRDAADAHLVEAALAATALRDVPRFLLHAPVCRPTWLVEIEGQGIDAHGDPRFDAF